VAVSAWTGGACVAVDISSRISNPSTLGWLRRGRRERGSLRAISQLLVN
jgi:hypothetical protein